LKNIFTPALFLFMSAGCLALQSCQKTETIKDLSTMGATNKGGSGGGGGNTGGGGGGKNGGGGGGGTIAPPTSTDTTTSQLPVADIITVGKWKVTYFVQGNDNNTSQFASYIFTFNSDGSVVADDKGTQTIGYWHYQEAVFYYGIPVYGSSPYGFTMNFGILPLASLNENYFISKKTLTTIYIDSVNPNENAHLIFSKL
jgi:hypothetical protein